VGRAPVAAVAALVIALAACGSTAPATPSPASKSPAASGLAREAANPDPNFDYGFTVQVTAGGVRPHWLVAACCQPITWKNLTTAPVSVVFDHLAINSGPVPPGGTFVFTPKNVESIAYHLAETPAVTGVVQVNTPLEP
jgi:hypothetical protein